MNQDKCSKIKEDNKNFFDEENNKYKINNKIFKSNNLLTIDNEVIKLVGEYYSEKPIDEHCYQFGLEKWHDWFTIPHYYLTNNIKSENVSSIYENTWSIGKCYDKCTNNQVVSSNPANIGSCVDIKLFENGKYKDYIPYDPIALICIILTYYKSEFDELPICKIYTEENSYSYIDILSKYYDIKKENDGTIKNNINKNVVINDASGVDIKDFVEFEFNSNILSNSNYEKIFKEDIQNAILNIHTYIQDITDIVLKDSYIDKAETEDNLNKSQIQNIKKLIEKDIDKFYYLFDDKDKYYLTYLKDKINISKPLGLGKYCGAQYAYYLSKQSIKKFKEKKISGDQYDNNFNNFLYHILDYSIKLCFTSDYLFYSRLINYKIIEKIVDNHEDDNNNDDSINTQFNERVNNNIKIDKEVLASFNNYEYVFKYFNSLPTIAFIIVLSIALITSLYYLLFWLQLLSFSLQYLINFPIMLIFYITSNVLGFMIWIFMHVITYTILFPINMSKQLYNAARPYLKAILLILLAIMTITSAFPNGRKIILYLIKIIWMILIGIGYLIINISITILKYPILISLLIIYIIYIIYSIIVNDIETLGNYNVDMIYKHKLIFLQISIFIREHVKYGIDNYEKTLKKYKLI